MSVHILYKGRLGNHLFQYVTARIFAKNNGLKLATPFTHPEFVSMAPHEEADWVELSVHNKFVVDGEDVLGLRSRGRYVFDGYFQDSERVHSLRPEILEFSKVKEVEPADPMDIVINLRLGEDYANFGWIIDPSWYLGILEGESFRKLHIVTDRMDFGYLSHFKKYEPVVVSSGPNGDWDYLRKFQRMICANSTFCWWAAFFSKATRIYTFKKWVGRPEVKLGRFPNGIEVDGRFLVDA